MEIFTVKEVAEYLNCSVSSIRNMVKKKEIPHFKIGVKLNFNKEAIDNWIHNQEINNMQKLLNNQFEVISIRNGGKQYDKS